MRHVRCLIIQVALASIWPSYLALLAYLARIAPWPRALARPCSFALGYLAVSLLVAALARFLLGPGRWAESELNLKPEVARLLRRAIWTLAGAGLLFLLPALMLGRGLIAPEGRPSLTPSICRVLVLAYEVVVLIVASRLIRPSSPLVEALTAGGGWLGRHRRALTTLVLSGIGLVVALDARGYSYTARRLAAAGGQAAILVVACVALYGLLIEMIEHHAWRWAGQKDEASAVKPGRRDDIPARLRRLAAWVAPGVGVLVGSWVWRFDFALFRYIGELPLLPNGEGGVTVADVSKAVFILALTIAVWRHLDAVFSFAVYPRMPDDPGIRFAALTLTRYAALGAGLVMGLSAVHLGLERIGMVLAALGVGLGFGLQEIVSNFVSGIILLVERPIRVGDIVTVSSMSGRVDRINIRATTIINGDNQSIIVPNREFITSNLVNWTHKDRIVRATIHVGVSYGNSPDRVSELLLSIANEDEEVLGNPVPDAQMESFGEFSLHFTLHVHVADPSVAGRVKHRLYRRIQDQFAVEGIQIPLPSREFHIRSVSMDPSWLPVTAPGAFRADPPSPTPPGPRMARTCPQPAEPSHRGVDE